MAEVTANKKIEQACVDALEKFKKLGEEDFSEIISKLEFVITSYRADGNPVGLYEIGEMALAILKDYKMEKPRQVSKKLIETLEKAIAEQQA